MIIQQQLCQHMSVLFNRSCSWLTHDCRTIGQAIFAKRYSVIIVTIMCVWVFVCISRNCHTYRHIETKCDVYLLHQYHEFSVISHVVAFPDQFICNQCVIVSVNNALLALGSSQIGSKCASTTAPLENNKRHNYGLQIYIKPNAVATLLLPYQGCQCGVGWLPTSIFAIIVIQWNIFH